MKSRVVPGSPARNGGPRNGVGRRIGSAVAGLCLFVLVNPLARGQHEGHGQIVGWVPQEILERPVTLREDIGVVHEKVTTSVPQAQSFYDQGLAYLHSFVWIEAARSFHQALHLDPNLAMAYAGLADAYMGLLDPVAARAALEKAQSLSASASEPEERKIRIRALLLDWYDSKGDLHKYFAYRGAISEAITATPTDPWLWIQRGFADEGSPQAHGQNGGVDTVAFYEMAIHLQPDEFPAHHYLAHTFETIGRNQDALVQSTLYVQMAPAIPHAHHMHGHDLRRLGRTEEAIAEFQRAGQLEDAYYASERIPAQYDWHHAHNLNLLAMCYQALGQMKSAEKEYREAFALPVYADLAEYNRREWPEFLLDRGRYSEALAAAQQLALGRWDMGRFAGNALAARILLRLNRVDEAQAELALAQEQLQHLPSNVTSEVPDADLAAAEIVLRQGKVGESNQMFRQLVARIRAVPGPDAWSEALFQLQAIARTARDAGDWELAEFVAKQMIDHDPSFAGGYYALAVTEAHAGNNTAARAQFDKAAKLWDKADADLPELSEVRQKVAAAP